LEVMEVWFPVTVSKVSSLSLVIALLQLCAVAFNLLGCRSLPRALKAYGRARIVESKARGFKSRAFSEGALRACLRARSDVAYGIVRACLAPSFFILALFTLKSCDQYLLEYALLLMQAALALALWAMWLDLGFRQRKAQFAEDLHAVSSSDSDSELVHKIAYLDFDDDVLGMPQNTKPRQKPSSLTALVEDLSSSDILEEAGDKCDTWLKEALVFVKAHPAYLRALSQKEKKLAAVDLVVWLLNGIAFAGYLVFPMTYFGPFQRDPRFEWLGNFFGDLAWTIEPAVVLAAAIAFANSNKPKTE